MDSTTQKQTKEAKKFTTKSITRIDPTTQKQTKEQQNIQQQKTSQEWILQHRQQNIQQQKTSPNVVTRPKTVTKKAKK